LSSPLFWVFAGEEKVSSCELAGVVGERVLPEIFLLLFRGALTEMLLLNSRVGPHPSPTWAFLGLRLARRLGLPEPGENFPPESFHLSASAGDYRVNTFSHACLILASGLDNWPLSRHGDSDDQSRGKLSSRNPFTSLTQRGGFGSTLFLMHVKL